MESNANASNKIIPHENDILLGRGGKNNRHSGNERLRNLARTYVDAYTRSTKKGKSNISWDLVQAVRSMKPPGRFLKRDSVSGTWQDVGDDAAREKTSQAMRDAIAASINNHYSFGIHPYTSTTSGNGIDGGRNTGLFPLPTPHGPSRTLTFPTYGGDSLTVSTLFLVCYLIHSRILTDIHLIRCRMHIPIHPSCIRVKHIFVLGHPRQIQILFHPKT